MFTFKLIIVNYIWTFHPGSYHYLKVKIKTLAGDINLGLALASF